MGLCQMPKGCQMPSQANAAATDGRLCGIGIRSSSQANYGGNAPQLGNTLHMHAQVIT